ncbi:MAG: glycosyltransferase [bacterium]|nr:MAG: glycosyltransferase [bacterium]
MRHPAGEDRLTLAYLSIGRHIHTERWLTWFARRGHRVHLLTVQPGPMPGVTVHDITTTGGPKFLRYAKSLRRVKEILAVLDPDLLHTHFLTGYGYWGHFSGRKPHMLTVWGDDVYVTPFESPLKQWLARQVLAGADYVTGDSRDIIEACIRLGAKPDRSEVIQWGVDFAKFHPDAAGPVRDALGIPPTARVVLSTRSFTQAYYNIDVIIDSIPIVRREFPDVVYIIAGNEGSDEVMRARARERGVEEACRFVGRIPHADLPAFLTTSHVYLTVPSVDATAVSLLEAMATGTAVICSDLASATEWIHDRESGRVVRPRDIEGLATTTIELLGDPSARARYGRRAVEMVRAGADHDRSMARVEEIYRGLVARR